MTPMEISGAGLLLGLAAGPACLFSCALTLLPILISCGNRDGPSRFAWLPLLRFQGGRLVAYMAVGLIFGIAGTTLDYSKNFIAPWPPLVLAILLILHAFGLSLPRRFCGLWKKMAGWRNYPFIFGALTGLSPCPPFLLAISWTWQQALGPTVALTFFLAFFLGTSLYLLPVGFGGYLPQTPAINGLGRGAAFLAGIFFLLHS